MPKIRFYICSKRKDAEDRARALRLSGYATEISNDKKRSGNKLTVWGWIYAVTMTGGRRGRAGPTPEDLKDIENNGI